MATSYADKQSSGKTSTTAKPFFSPSNTIQKQPDERTATAVDYRSMIDLDAANKSNILSMNQFSNERYLLALFLNIHFTVTTSKPASNESEDITPLTLAIAKWQDEYQKDTSGKFKKTKSPTMSVTGRYKDALPALVENGFDPKGKTQDWKNIDKNDAKEVLETEKKFKESVKNNATNDAKRQAIVDLAVSQAGTVVSVNRGDNSKIGWERIARFYEVAQEEYNGSDQFKRTRDTEGAPTDTPTETDLKKSKLAGIKAANKFANDKTGDWSWCGIFTVWAIRSILGKGSWNAGPQGFGEKKTTDLTNAKKGDIINIKNESNPNNHHFLLAQDIPSTATDSYILRPLQNRRQ
jgi:hypothetical protein